MDAEETARILSGLIRIGTVTNVDNARRTARVKFQSEGMSSGWLYVLAARPYIPDYDGAQRTEYEAGGGGYAAFASHPHPLVIKPWMPKINATVLCVYLPVDNADGFILGEIGGAGEIKQ